jgi:hypothetical protein
MNKVKINEFSFSLNGYTKASNCSSPVKSSLSGILGSQVSFHWVQLSE